MSQTTTSIFASPGLVLPGTRSESKMGPTTLVVPKLIVSDSTGKAIQSWDLKLPKGTLGSADSCTICCRLPGIAPLHAMLVSGSQQAFVRSLAGQLSQDGIPATELLLSDDKCYFEISGYRFTLMRAPRAQVETARKEAKRMQFALARPFNLTTGSPQSAEKEAKSDEINALWVANVIRQSIEPLEAQIDSLLLPLAEFQSQSLQAQFANARLEEDRRAVAEKERSAKEQEIVGMVVQQSATMETLAERFGDVNQQLSTIERIIAQDSEANSAANSEIAKVITVQQSAIEQLQNGMVSVSDSLKQLQQRQETAQLENANWKSEVQLELQQLTNAVSVLSSVTENADQSALVDAIESLKQTHEVAQAEIGRWQSGVQQQLNNLQETLTENERIAQTEVPTAIAEALAEIQSKHAQSLEELHSWKAELKQEMQQLFQSASAASVQSSSPPSSSNSVQGTTYLQQSVAIGPVSEVPSQLDPISGAAQAQPAEPIELNTWRNYSTSSIVAQDASVEFNEPVAPELVDEDFFSQIQTEPKVDSASAAWGSGESFFATQDTASDEPIEPESSWASASDISYQSSQQQGTASELANSWPAQEFDVDAQSQMHNYDPSQYNFEGVGQNTEDSPFMTMQIEPVESTGFEPSLLREDVDVGFESNELTGSSSYEKASPFNQHNDQLQATDDALDSFITVKDPLGKVVDHPATDEAESSASASLPAWWTADEKEDLASEEQSLAHESPKSHLTSATFDSPSDFETLNSRASEIDAVSGLTQGLDVRPVASAKEEDEEQFFGLGMEATSVDEVLPRSSGVMSIDQLALMSDEPNQSENIFDFTPQNPEPASPYSPPVTPAPAKNSSPSPVAASPGSEDDSVEAYMKSLLARMRGGETEAAPEPPKPVAPTTPTSGYAPSNASQQSAARQAAETAANSTEPIAPFDFENYVPLTNAPEKGKNISALRDLANSTARTAIHKSARNRTLSGSLMKFAIAAIAFTVAAALIAINGFVVNVALCATVAALLVGVIWSFDGLKSLKPLLQNSLVLQPEAGRNAETEE